MPYITLSCTVNHRLCQILIWEYLHVHLDIKQSKPKIVSEYDQDIPQSQTADNPMAPQGRVAQPSLNNTCTIKLLYITQSYFENNRLCQFLEWEYFKGYLDIKQNMRGLTNIFTIQLLYIIQLYLVNHRVCQLLKWDYFH